MGESRVAAGLRAAGLPETSCNSSDQSPPTTRLINFLIIYVVASNLRTRTVTENNFYQMEFSTCALFPLLSIVQTQILSNDESEASPPVFSKGLSHIIDQESVVII